MSWMEMANVSRDLLAELLHLPAPWQIDGWRLDAAQRKLTIELSWPGDVAVLCPTCQRACNVHDHREPRHWRHLDCMEFQSWLVCRLPRAKCPTHGVQTVQVPWAEPMARMTRMLEAHCIEVMQCCQTIAAAERLLGLSDHELGSVRRRAVERGLLRRQNTPLIQGGLDEKSFRSGQSFVTVLSDLLRGCVLEVTQDRTQQSAELALQSIPPQSRPQVEAMAMDMHKPFQHAVEKVLPSAAIVHDRFHIKSHLNDAVNKVRREEHKQLSAEGDRSLSRTRYLFLKNPDRLTDEQSLTFAELAAMQLKVTRAWGLKELFDDLYRYRSPTCARRFFDKWFHRATHSKLPAMSKVAWMLKRHVDNIVTYAKHRITNAVAEGLNSKIQILKSAARGFRSFPSYRIAILFHCGHLDMLPTF